MSTEFLDSLHIHAGIWVEQLASELRERGQDPTALLERYDLSSEPSGLHRKRLSFSQVAGFFEAAAELLQDPSLGLHFGQTRDERDVGLIAYVGLSSSSVLHALKNVARYCKLFNEFLEFDVAELDRSGCLTWQYRTDKLQPCRQFTEFTSASLLGALRRLSNAKIAPLSIAYEHSRPKEATELLGFFGCPVHFAQISNKICFSQLDLRRGLLTSDHRLLALLKNYCEEILSQQTQEPSNLVVQVERLIVYSLHCGDATLQKVASALGLGSRTLSRRLARNGHGFNDLVNDIRRNLALKYLRESELSLTEITYLLGYTDTSTLIHAVKRWTGKTPKQLRSIL